MLRLFQYSLDILYIIHEHQSYCARDKCLEKDLREIHFVQQLRQGNVHLLCFGICEQFGSTTLTLTKNKLNYKIQLFKYKS